MTKNTNVARDKPVQNAAMSIVFLDSSTLDLGDLDLSPIRQCGSWQAYSNTASYEIIERLRSAEIVITNKCVLTAAHFQALPDLRLVCVTATGVNNIDLDAARAHGIAVANVRNYSTPSVAEHAFLLMLALSHRFLVHERAAREDWHATPSFAVLDFPFTELAGKTLGIMGYGAIGQAVSRIARAYRMKVKVAALPGRHYADSRPRITRMAFDEVLRSSDFVSLHTALTEHTRHLISREALSKMKKTAYLLNLARGDIVDEHALVQSLRAGEIAGYASDVLAHEPPREDHPLFSDDLRDRVLLTPHVAWASRESRARMVDEIAKNIRAFIQGRSRNRVV